MLSEEEIKRCCKEVAKERVEFRKRKRQHDRDLRYMERCYEASFGKPKREKEARKQALAEQRAARVHEADEWYKNL